MFNILQAELHTQCVCVCEADSSTDKDGVSNTPLLGGVVFKAQTGWWYPLVALHLNTNTVN